MAGSIIFAPETGGYSVVPSTGWLDFGVNADNYKSNQLNLTRNTLSLHRGGPKRTGRRVKRGAADGSSLPLDLSSNGLHWLLRTTASTALAELLEDGVYQQVMTWGTDLLPGSVSVEKYVERSDGGGFDGYDVFLYPGGKPKSFKIAASTEEGFATVEFGMDHADNWKRQTVDPNRTVTEIEPDITFAMDDVTLTLLELDADGATVGSPIGCFKSFEYEYEVGIDPDGSRCMTRGESKKEPTRKTDGTGTGTLDWKYRDPQFFDAFVEGTGYQVTANWTGPVAIGTVDGDDVYPSIEFVIACIEFDEANDPLAKIDDYSEQPLPFVMKDPEVPAEGGGLEPVMTWTGITTDVAEYELPETGS